MTEIVVNLTRHAATGRVPAAGVLRWTPTRRVHIDAPTDGAVDEVVVPAPFTVQVDGPTVVAVDPSGTSWAWTVHEATQGGRTIRTVAVPDSPTPVDYGDLVDVDPATLTPAAEPTAAWWAAHDALTTGTDAWLVEARRAATDAQAAETGAEGSAAAAQASQVAAALAETAAATAAQHAEDMALTAGMADVTAYPDPANPDLLILSYPAYLSDGLSVTLPIGA